MKISLAYGEARGLWRGGGRGGGGRGITVPSGEGEGHHIIEALGLAAELAQHANDVQSSQRHHSRLSRSWPCNQEGLLGAKGGGGVGR